MSIDAPTAEQLAFQEMANKAELWITESFKMYQETIGSDDASISALLSGTMAAMVRHYAAMGTARGEVMTERRIVHSLNPLLHQGAARFVNDLLLDKRN